MASTGVAVENTFADEFYPRVSERGRKTFSYSQVSPEVGVEQLSLLPLDLRVIVQRCTEIQAHYAGGCQQACQMARRRSSYSAPAAVLAIKICIGVLQTTVGKLVQAIFQLGIPAFDSSVYKITSQYGRAAGSGLRIVDNVPRLGL